MRKVYKNYDNHFSDVTAKMIMRDDKQVGKIAFKFMKSGMVYAYVHEYGYTMTSGSAGGGGYDKMEAALEQAISVLDEEQQRSELYSTLKHISGDGEWENVLRASEYEVINVL